MLLEAKRRKRKTGPIYYFKAVGAAFRPVPFWFQIRDFDQVSYKDVRDESLRMMEENEEEYGSETFYFTICLGK